MDTRTATLLAWYRRNSRALPWRSAIKRDGTPDAYRIFISELMLQQTQVPRVIPKYKEWLKHFSSWKKLANAPTSELIQAWAGLGYNRRALQAREAARHVVEHGEPTTEEEWRQLKGVGPYMAAALTEFANNKRAIVIDTNVRRVAGRIALGIPHPRPINDEEIRHVLEVMTPTKNGHRDLPQAFMDLGSDICRVRAPSCAICPMRRACKAAPIFLAGGGKPVGSSKPKESKHAEKPYPDRIYRGRILALVRAKPINREHIGTNIDPDFDPVRDTEWRNRMIERLIKDGLLVMNARNTLSLPPS